MSDKDCSDIAAFKKYFPDAQHLFCHFHVLKAVDDRLKKQVDGKGLSQEEKHEIRKQFRKAMYADSEKEYEAAKKFLTGLGNITVNMVK